MFAYQAVTLNWLLPLNSSHLALPTLSTKPRKEMQLGRKNISKKKKKKPSQQNVLPSAGSTAWLWCSQCSPHEDAGSVHLCSPGSAASAATPPQGMEDLHNVPIHWAHPSSVGCPEPPQSCRNVLASRIAPMALICLVSHITPMASAVIHLVSYIALSVAAFTQCCALC